MGVLKMSHLSCKRCGLQIKIRAAFLRIDNCPRCLARSATVSPLALHSGGIHPVARRTTQAAGQPAIQR
jgi:hypothetical protein